MANCNITWDILDGDVPNSLVKAFIFYCYGVCFIGIFCNCVALWCVTSCTRTTRAFKVLLFSLFSSTLLICLLVMPFMAQVALSKIHCDRSVPSTVTRGMVAVYIILTEMELIYITIMASLRAVAVWSVTKRKVKLRLTIALSVGTVIYSTVMTVLVLFPFWFDLLSDKTGETLSLVYNTFNFVAPVVVIIACYLCMMVAVRRNKQRLLRTSAPDASSRPGKVMDQATRAILAVFISNLLLGLPHSIFHILPYDDQDGYTYIMVHIVYYTHFFVDPLAFVFSNLHHRQRILGVLSAIKACLQSR